MQRKNQTRKGKNAQQTKVEIEEKMVQPSKSKKRQVKDLADIGSLMNLPEIKQKQNEGSKGTMTTTNTPQETSSLRSNSPIQNYPAKKRNIVKATIKRNTKKK